MIDYSKAFDTIDHESLVRKLVSLNFSKRLYRAILPIDNSMFKWTINNLHGYQYTSESHKAVSWARLY